MHFRLGACECLSCGHKDALSPLVGADANQSPEGGGAPEPAAISSNGPGDDNPAEVALDIQLALNDDTMRWKNQLITTQGQVFALQLMALMYAFHAVRSGQDPAWPASLAQQSAVGGVEISWREFFGITLYVITASNLLLCFLLQWRTGWLRWAGTAVAVLGLALTCGIVLGSILSTAPPAALQVTPPFRIGVLGLFLFFPISMGTIYLYIQRPLWAQLAGIAVLFGALVVMPYAVTGHSSFAEVNALLYAAPPYLHLALGFALVLQIAWMVAALGGWLPAQPLGSRRV